MATPAPASTSSARPRSRPSNAFPEAVYYLASQQRLHVLCCGLPVWATLEQVIRTKNLDADVVLAGLKKHLAARG
jgi:hypothetical protein